jgi:hypothetical protein
MIVLALFACNSKKSSEEGAEGFSYAAFSKLFRVADLPYQISDAEAGNNKDTTVIRSTGFAKFVPDSIKTTLFGKGAKIKYFAVARLKTSKTTDYYIVKATAGNKKMALLLPFTNGKYAGVFPFLVPDSDPSTSQTSSIDKSNGIIKSISQKKPGGVTAEGRNVYQYDAGSGQFLLILTNPLNNDNTEVVNPIDTFSRKGRFAADYVKDKKNFVSVRDGRTPNQLMVFIHIDKNDCSGELKGQVLMTSATTAVYRQGGDPCGLTLHFSASSVQITEDGGCGSHRGLDCSFDGTFNRKKIVKSKTTKKKPASK